MYPNGNIYSHSLSGDNGKSTPMDFQKGDIVTVAFDPSSGVLKYSKRDGKAYSQNTSIRSTTNDPIYFFARLEAGDVVSLVE